MNFLSEYIESLCSKRNCYSRLSDDGRSLGFIWAIEGIETELLNIFDLLITEQPYGSIPLFDTHILCTLSRI